MHLWSPLALLRLSFAQNSARLADRCRDQVVGVTLPAERLVEAALATARDAEALLVNAVAAERAGGVSWEQIGEQLGCSRQAAQKRFGADIDHLRHGVLLPIRDGWVAGPDCVWNPDSTAEQLDEWIRQRPGVAPASLATLNDPLDSAALIAGVTELAQIATTAFGMLSTAQAPRGAGEHYVRQRLLEFKIAAFDAIASNGSGSEDDRRQADVERAAAQKELGGLFAERTRGELRIEHHGGGARFTFADDDGAHRTVASVEYIDTAPVVRPGWYVVATDARGNGGSGEEARLDLEPDTPIAAVVGVAVHTVAQWVGRDLARGVGPFDDDGIAVADS